MPPLEWDKVMSAKVASLSDDQIEEFYESMIDFKVDDVVETGKLQKLFDVAKVVMKSKHEVGEEVLKTMEEEAKEAATKDKQAQSKMKELEKKVAELGKYGPETGGAAGGTARVLRENVSELERQNEDLQSEIKDLRKDLASEKIAAEKYSERISELEKDMKDLRQDNDQMRQDITDYKMQLQSQASGMATRRGDEADFREKLAKRNHELAEAMEELQNLTDANEAFERQIADLQRNLDDAVNQMDKTTEDYLKLKKVLEQSDAVTDKLREENDVLNAQVADLNEQVQSKTDADDAIMVAVNEKIEEWREILSQKDAVIVELQGKNFALNENLIAATMDTDKASVAALSKVIKDKDKQIEELTDQIKVYVDEMEANAALMEDMKGELQRTGTGPGDQQQKRIRELTNEIKYLKQKLKDHDTDLTKAEDDARDKDKELIDALERMSKYESGEYGLAEAVQEIKDCKHQVRIRDRQIEELTQVINKIEMKFNDLEEENEDLRYRLGLDPREPIDLTEFKANKSKRKEEEKALNFILQREIEKLEDERIDLKKKMRKMAQTIGQRAVALGLPAEDMIAVMDFQEELKTQRMQKTGPSIATAIRKEVEKEESQIKFDDYHAVQKENFKEIDNLYRENAKFKSRTDQLEKENKQLEQGLKEVIENLKTYSPEKGEVETQMQFPTLEKMLAAIEAKNLLGNYDTSLFLKAQVDNLQGRNEELRNELKQTRLETSKAKLETQKAIEKIEKLEGDLKIAVESGGGPGGVFQTMPLPDSMATTSAEVIASINEHLIVTLQELSIKEQSMKEMENSLENYKRKFAVMRHQQGLVYHDYLKDKKEWEEETQKIKDKLAKVEGEREEDRVRIQEFDRLIDTLSKDDTEVRRRLSDMTRRITVLRVNEKALTRRYNTSEEVEGQLRKDINRYKNDMASVETAVAERMGYLQRYKDMATFKIAALQKALEDSIPVSELDRTNKKLHEVTEKYRDHLEKGNSLVSKAEALTGLEEEVKHQTEDNDSLRRTLETEKEKLHALEAALEDLHRRGVTDGTEIKGITDGDAITISKKITTLEMKELNERQRAEHAVRMYEQQKSILHNLEERNKDLEEKFSQITKSNLELQKIERELRDELTNSVTKEVSDADRKKISSLEEEEIKLKQEISKLKEISEVATSQVKSLETLQLSREKENASLRQQLLDFQIQSDEKTIIGKLHRHIVQLQVSEGTAVRKYEEVKKKVSKTEALVLRLEQKLDDKNQTIYHNRKEAQDKSNHLKKNLQDLRLQFAGAIPLTRQEKFSHNMMQLQQDKSKLEMELKKVKEERYQVEEKLAVLELQHRSLQDLIATLKDGRGAAKVMEWHSKLDAVRIEELKHKRLNSKLQQQTQYLEGIIRSNEAMVADLEADNVHQTKDFEEKQLRWEHREVELERTIGRLEGQAAEIAGAASKFEQALGSLPDHKLPVANQLEEAITTIKSNVKIILDTQAESKVLRKRNQELEKHVRQAEQTIIARDKLIAELRLRMPATADRDEIILSATSKVTSAMQQKPGKEKEYRTEHSIKIAQSTISSLQARLNQKEETIAKYQELLNQAREDMMSMNKRHEQDLKNMQEKIHMNTDAAFNKFKDAARELMQKQHVQPASNKQIGRLHELEDAVAEQDNAMAAMSAKIKQKDDEITNLRLKLQQITKQHASDKDYLTGEVRSHSEKKDKEVDDHKRQVEHMRKEIELLTQEVDTLKDQNNRAPTTTMKNMVDRLKNQLALKEKQHQSLSKALTELRADMIQQAQDQVKHTSDESEQQINVQKIIDKHTKEFVDQIEDLQAQVDKLRKEVKKRKENESTLQTDLDDLREEIGRKEKNLQRFKSDKHRLEGEVDDLEKKVDRMSTMKTQKTGDDARQQETEELRRRVRLLEDELKRKQQQPEKPYERPREPEPAQPKREKTDEMIKWEESKKWQKTVEKMKLRLKDKEEENERILKANKVFKDQFDRAEREKETLQRKLTNLQRGPTGGPSIVSSGKPDHQIEAVKTQNYQLQEEVSNLRRQLAMDKDAAFQDLQTKNTYLQQQLEQREHREQIIAQKAVTTSAEFSSSGTVAAREYQEIFEKNQSLQRQMLALSEENIEFKFENEQLRKDVPRLRGRVKDLQKYVEALKIENAQLGGHNSSRSGGSMDSITSSGIRRIGESGKSTRELEKTVALLKKVVERVQTENEILKKTAAGEANIRVQTLQLENEGLKGQLEDLRNKMGSTLSERYTSQQKGTAKMMTDYEKMRKDLMKEIETNEKLRSEIRNLEFQKEQLNAQLQDSKSMSALDRTTGSQQSVDTKGWKASVATRMYEGKLKDVETDLAKKNKMLSDTKILLKEAAEREQLLLQEREELRQKVSAMERFPKGHKGDMGRDLQQSRLQIERLENEKQELLHKITVLKQQTGPGAQEYDTDAQNKMAAYDRLMNENVEIKMSLKSAKTEKDKMRLEVERMKKELHNFGPDFFEEIEDLKYNYKQALEKNILYEEKMTQYGLTIDLPGGGH
ncbi:centrosomal protein of 290 kDa-like isoform X1 [Mytilus edulis]|uniref:centrosomal protein of 290 kDa-like isoform X1 n=1 Tax=Mytilus edulis TaxID=6550 RepID=UPI0039F0A698